MVKRWDRKENYGVSECCFAIKVKMRANFSPSSWTAIPMISLNYLFIPSIYSLKHHSQVQHQYN